MKNQSHTSNGASVNRKALTISRSISIIFNVAISAGILFLAAGQTNWPFAWLYILSYLIFQLLSMRVSLRHGQIEKHPQKRSFLDRVFEIGYSLTHPITLILAGFEFSLTRNPFALGTTIQSIAYLFLLLIFALMIWTQWENPYYHSQISNFQQGQEIVRTGPYQFIRHPGYAGLLMLAIARPLVLGSRLGLLAGMIGAFIIIVRTLWEDRALKKNSADYEEYARDVRHRIFSGIW
ncbi:MAG TPA: isoprenylcysteine carboxylmethyltransferase family protein [Anaerolineales bacterium]|nr:isoprenylcysteine carboxylmethyltransferase family protein [Anaerolineales bacterium]